MEMWCGWMNIALAVTIAAMAYRWDADRKRYQKELDALKRTHD